MEIEKGCINVLGGINRKIQCGDIWLCPNHSQSTSETEVKRKTPKYNFKTSSNSDKGGDSSNLPKALDSSSDISLSEKVIKLTDGKDDNWMSCVLRDDVKEFIRRLKELCCNNTQCCCDEIDKLAGSLK